MTAHSEHMHYYYYYYYEIIMSVFGQSEKYIYIYILKKIFLMETLPHIVIGNRNQPETTTQVYA